MYVLFKFRREKLLYYSTFQDMYLLDGLEDSFRWALIRRLSEFGEKLYYDANIARKFATVPDASCTDEYVDLISARRWIEKRWKNGRHLSYCEKYNKNISPRLIWRYVKWSNENSFYDPSVYDCCKKLVDMDGWIALLQIQCLNSGRGMRKAWRRNRKSIKTFGYMD